MRNPNIVILFVLALVYTSCTSIKPLEVKYRPIQGSGFYSTSAATKSTMVKHKDENIIVCSEPAPDATFDEQDGGSLGFSFLHVGDQASGGASGGETEAGLGGRSVNVLLTRVMFFRMCEFFANTNLPDSMKVEIYKSTVQSVLSLNQQNFGVGTQNGATTTGTFSESNSITPPVIQNNGKVKSDSTSSGSPSANDDDKKDCDPFSNPNCNS